MIPTFTRVASTVPAERALAVPAPVAASVAPVWLATLTERLRLYLLYTSIAVLLIRPSDLVPALIETPLYETLIMACLLMSLPGALRLLTPRALLGNAPLLLCTLFVPALMLSHLASVNTYDARLGGVEALKALALVCLTVSIIDSPAKFRGLLGVFVASVLVVTVTSVLHYHEFIDVPAIAGVEHRFIEGDDESTLLRLRGVGLFHDPNDFALLLVSAGLITASAFGGMRSALVRVALCVPLAILGYALFLTHSRGGVLSAAAGILAFFVARVGVRNGVIIAVGVVPAGLLLLSRRQSTLNLADPQDTFQTRLGLWSDSLVLFRESPITGIGQDKLVDRIGQVSHNSFLHAFAEMGLMGGVLFLGVFVVLLVSLWQARGDSNGESRLRPYVFALIAAYAGGLMSLSRCYTVSTQLTLTIGIVFLMVNARSGGIPMPQWNWTWARRVALASVGFLFAAQVLVRVMLQRGGT